MPVFFLARHGQTDWNKVRRLQGSTDTDLNDVGRGQAFALAERFRTIELDAIHCSTLARARQTAEPLAAKCETIFDERLVERRMGRFEGTVLDGGESEAEYRRRKYLPGDDLDGGETIEAFRGRIDAVLDELASAPTTNPRLIIAHGAVNTLILARFLDLDLDGILKLWVRNDDLFRIETEDGRRGRVWREMTTAAICKK